MMTVALSADAGHNGVIGSDVTHTNVTPTTTTKHHLPSSDRSIDKDNAAISSQPSGSTSSSSQPIMARQQPLIVRTTSSSPPSSATLSNPTLQYTSHPLKTPLSPITHASNNSSHPRCIQTLESQPRRAISCVTVNEGKLYAGSKDGAISEWDLTTWQLTRILPTPHTKGVTSLAASGSRLYSASEDGTVVIWNLASAQVAKTIRGHDGYVTAVCVTPDGKLYSGGADRVINAWDVASGRRLWVLTGHTRWVLALCAAGNKLYSGGNDHTIRVWDMTTGRCLMTLSEHTDWVFSLCLGRDLLYSSSKDGTVRVWDTSTGQCLRTLKGHDGAGVRAVCVAGGRLYSAGDDKAIVEWDVKQGRPTKTLGGHFGGISSLCAGHDGRLFSGSSDCTVKVWEIIPPGIPPSSPATATNPSMFTASAGNFQGGASATPAASANSNQRAPPERRHTVMVGSGNQIPVEQQVQQNQNPVRQSTLARMASLNMEGVSAFFNSPSSTQPSSTTANNNSNMSINNEDLDGLKSQLEKAQDLLVKQNRAKFRLKQDLQLARTEIASLRSSASQLEPLQTRVQELEEELAAAKELLVAYKVELSAAQEAHLWCLEHILRRSDGEFMEVELEVAGVRHLLESPWTPLVKEGEGGDGLLAYMPAKRVERVWEKDDDWDSDVEIEEDMAWWRYDKNGGKKAGSGSEADSADDESADQSIGKKPRPQSVINKRLQAAVDAKRKARLQQQQDQKTSDVFSKSPSKKRSTIILDKVSELDPFMGQMMSIGELQDEPSEDFDLTDDDESTADPVLWNKPVQTKSQPPRPQSRRATVADPSRIWQNVAGADKQEDAPPRQQQPAQWNIPTTETNMNDDAAAALWVGPVKKGKEGSLVAGSEAGEPVVNVESGGLWTGPIVKAKVKSAAAEFTGMTAPLMNLSNLESVVWSGTVKSSGRSETHSLASTTHQLPESALWNGPIVPKAPSVVSSVALSSDRRGKKRSQRDLKRSATLADTLTMERTEVPKLEPYAVGGLPPLAQPPFASSSAGALAGFGDHARTAPSPIPVPVRSQSVFVGGPNGNSGSPMSPNNSTSWFKPLRNWVESIGEQLVVTPPAQSTSPPNQSHGEGVGENEERDRMRREIRERDEAARREVELLLSGSGLPAASGGHHVSPTEAAPAAIQRNSSAQRTTATHTSNNDNNNKNNHTNINAHISTNTSETKNASTSPDIRTPKIKQTTSSITATSSNRQQQPPPRTRASVNLPPTPFEMDPDPTSPPPRTAAIMDLPAPPDETDAAVEAREVFKRRQQQQQQHQQKQSKRKKSLGEGGVDWPPLEKVAVAFENVIETAIEDPWSLVPGWLKSEKVEGA